MPSTTWPMLFNLEGGDLPGSPAVDSALPLQGAQVQSLVEELRSHLPYGAAINK